MNVYKVEILILDFDQLGADGIKDVIENTKYPNRCISPDIMKIEGKDIGEWADSHPLNFFDQRADEYKKLFG